MTTEFEIKPAVRESVGLLIGLVGPSGGGKTFSALRLATGIQRVAGGDVVMVDTENRRGTYYADRFAYHHLDLRAPLSAETPSYWKIVSSLSRNPWRWRRRVG